jgi:hypothetical protein
MRLTFPFFYEITPREAAVRRIDALEDHSGPNDLDSNLFPSLPGHGFPGRSVLWVDRTANKGVVAWSVAARDPTYFLIPDEKGTDGARFCKGPEEHWFESTETTRA